MFMIDADNEVIARDTMPAAEDGTIVFSTVEEFTAATAEWPINRLVETWNGFAGVVPFDDLKPVKKFENRQKAILRIWTAIQVLASPMPAKVAAPVATAALAAPKPAKAKKAPKAKAAKPAKPTGEPKSPREGTAKAQVIAMLQRKGGATMAEIAKATGWQNHSIRGFVSGTLIRKMALPVESLKNEAGNRVYRIAK